MRRRDFLGTAGLTLIFPGLAKAVAGETGEKIERLRKEKKEWRALLEESRYRILFEGATERPFSSPLLKEKREGLYVCAACQLPLFESRTKYESGTGWPSFFDTLEGRMGTKLDFGSGVPRTEYHCVRCSGHQGHIFRDGPAPTGKRWCNNGLALLFVPKDTELPPLRS